MRFHVLALPHTQTTASYSICAYTQKIRGFCRMMMDRGHKVFLYGGELNDAPCTEHIPLMSEELRQFIVGDGPYVNVSFDPNSQHWWTFNARCIEAVKERKKPRDFLCIIAGTAQKPVADALPDMLAVEWGIGYSGSFSKYRVFESYAWMHTCYGAEAGNASAADGRFFDAVIPGYLDPDEFPFESTSRTSDEYCLFIGRLIDRKGAHIAAQACAAVGKRLIVAGTGGTPPDGAEYVGPVGPEERGQLMAGASAVFVPTIYVEPFGNVAIEAMACGTPVISTDWGAMTETVIHGVTGYRCRTLSEFVKAVSDAPSLDRRAIRQHVVDNYSLEVIGKEYEDHFRRLYTLWDQGWDTLP